LGNARSNSSNELRAFLSFFGNKGEPFRVHLYLVTCGEVLAYVFLAFVTELRYDRIQTGEKVSPSRRAGIGELRTRLDRNVLQGYAVSCQYLTGVGFGDFYRAGAMYLAQERRVAFPMPFAGDVLRVEPPVTPEDPE
jgi:hypothetical protein